MIQGRYEILDEGVELSARHFHPRMRVLHAPSRVPARSAGRFADLIDEHLPQPAQIGLGELLVDPVIASDPIPEVLDDRGNSVDAAQSFI
jgi:hypothetical protein